MLATRSTISVMVREAYIFFKNNYTLFDAVRAQILTVGRCQPMFSGRFLAVRASKSLESIGNLSFSSKFTRPTTFFRNQNLRPDADGSGSLHCGSNLVNFNDAISLSLSPAIIPIITHSVHYNFSMSFCYEKDIVCILILREM